jgi:2-oxoglutarate dehydrogenase complex dehydrogenase (E1) component-like enzyme
MIDLDSSTDLIYNGKTLHVSLIPNPSHLEVNLIFLPFVLIA